MRNTKPSKRRKYSFFRTFYKSRAIRIFDTDNKLATELFSNNVINKRCIGISNM